MLSNPSSPTRHTVSLHVLFFLQYLLKTNSRFISTSAYKNLTRWVLIAVVVKRRFSFRRLEQPGIPATIRQRLVVPRIPTVVARRTIVVPRRRNVVPQTMKSATVRSLHAPANTCVLVSYTNYVCYTEECLKSVAATLCAEGVGCHTTGHKTRTSYLPR